MIDAEKLLGKVLAGAMQSGGGKKKKKKKGKKNDNLVGNLLGGLTSGKGLIAAIGLGVGAYEVYKHQTTGTTSTNQQKQVPPPVQQQPISGGAPPPIPGQQPPSPEAAPTEQQNLAILLIQTMVAAAHADGSLDSEEEERILEQLQEQELTQEEKQFLFTQLHTPKTVAELVVGVDDPVVAQTMYSLAVSTIVIDSPLERQWLDQLAAALSISTNLAKFIEDEL